MMIAPRVQNLVVGGSPAQKEAQRMVSEKVLASLEAATTVAAGGSPQKVLRRYRTIMRANTQRLYRDALDALILKLWVGVSFPGSGQRKVSCSTGTHHRVEHLRVDFDPARRLQ